MDFTPLSREAAMMISRCMVQCVGLFAFLSVYGLTRSVKKKYQSFEFSGREGTLLVLERYLHLVLFFTVPFFFCMGVTFLTDTSSYAKRTGKYTGQHCHGFLLRGTSFWYTGADQYLVVLKPGSSSYCISSVCPALLQKIQLADRIDVSDSGKFSDRKECTSYKIPVCDAACSVLCGSGCVGADSRFYDRQKQMVE